MARLKFPAPATMETWVTGQDGDPVFMVTAEPSDSLAGELRLLLPDLRAIAGQGRRVTVCFDRGGWSPALFADITAAGFDLLTWRKGPAPELPADTFTTITCADDRGRQHQYDLADTAVTLTIHDGPRKGQTVSLRQVSRRVPARGGGTRQIHALTSRTDLAAGEVCGGSPPGGGRRTTSATPAPTSPWTPWTPTPPRPTTRAGKSPTRRKRPPPPRSAAPRSSPPRPRPSATPAWPPCATRRPASRSPSPTR